MGGVPALEASSFIHWALFIPIFGPSHQIQGVHGLLSLKFVANSEVDKSDCTLHNTSLELNVDSATVLEFQHVPRRLCSIRLFLEQRAFQVAFFKYFD